MWSVSLFKINDLWQEVSKHRSVKEGFKIFSETELVCLSCIVMKLELESVLCITTILSLSFTKQDFDSYNLHIRLSISPI